MAAKSASHLKIADPATDKVSPRLALKSGGFFVAANLVAGFLHYLYQAVASRELPLVEFSALNAWYANLSVFFTLPTLLQFLANFLPLRTERLRPVILGLNAVLLIVVGIWFSLGGGLTLSSALLILIGAALYSWLSGQAQSRLLLGTMALGGLAVGLFKLLSLALPMQPRVDIYTVALLLGYVPGAWLLSFYLWRDQRAHPSLSMTWQKWLAPLILSAAAAIFPQMDLVLLNQTQSREAFGQIALASLFYKGIYFLVFAYLQWLLPQQVRAPGRRMALRPLVMGAAGGLFLSAAAALAGPSLGVLLLNWGSAPPASLIFLSCLNTCLLTWIFVQFQSECAAGRVRLAALASLALIVEAGIQFTLRLSLMNYLSLALVCQVAILVFLYSGTRPQAPPPPAKLTPV